MHVLDGACIDERSRGSERKFISILTVSIEAMVFRRSRQHCLAGNKDKDPRPWLVPSVPKIIYFAVRKVESGDMIYTLVLEPIGRESVSTSNAHPVVRERTSSEGFGRSSSVGSSNTGSLVGAECLSGANSAAQQIYFDW
jgi:hypothetical protein